MSVVTTDIQQEIHLASRPEGMPRPENFELVETDVPEPKDGEFLVQNEWISVDPYMRGRMRDTQSYVPPFELGQPMQGGCVGKVIESNHPDFATGDYVLGELGWRVFWTSDGSNATKIDAERSDAKNYLGVLGLTGMTAYYGLLKLGIPQQGDTVFVSAASGAVGSIVCQIAKIKGCRVVGSSGSPAKIEWLKDKAGIDEALNYHDADDLSARLAELCPNGIDIYFDNVGGDHLEAAIDNMNNFGRIVCCGMISGYNDSEPAPGPRNLMQLIGKRLRMEGFIVRDHMDIRDEFFREMMNWIDAGKIVWEETITEGIADAPQAFINLFEGDKMGKALVKV